MSAQNTNPVLCEVSRGSLVESRHTGAFAVVDATGDVIMSAGDIERPTYARSAIKPLQAIPLVESGAAKAFKLSTRELSLSCASHNSEVTHVDAVRSWLNRLGLDAGDLECGAHLPMFEPAAHAMIRAAEQPDAAHNNCSGKHSGFLTTARHMGEQVSGYIQPDHPVQLRLRRVLSEMSDTNLDSAPTGADGCGIPVIGMSLKATAYAMARFADPSGLDPARAQACRDIFNAVTREPFMVAGTDRFCTDVMSALDQRVLVKTGAEAYFCAAIPERSLGIAIKIDDGSKRGSEVVTAAVLSALLDSELLAGRARVAVQNAAGREVGEVRASLG